MDCSYTPEEVEEGVAEWPGELGCCPTSAESAGTAGGWVRQALPPPAMPPALHYSCSSSTLSQLSAVEEPQTPPHQLSPAIQASMAAWQSATSLLHDLAEQQYDTSTPPLLCLPPSQPPSVPLTPEQRQEAKLGMYAAHQGHHPAWLAALLALPHQQACEVSSPERCLAPLPPHH